MKFFYYFVTTGTAYKDGLDAYRTYFENAGGFLQAGIIAAVCAVVGGIIFYLLIGRRSLTLSTLSVWIATMLISGACSLAISYVNSGISIKAYGLSKVVEQQKAKKLKGLEKESTQYEKVMKEYKLIKRDMKGGFFQCAPVRDMTINNFVLTALFYFILSFFLRKASLYAINIPFILKKKNP